MLPAVDVSGSVTGAKADKSDLFEYELKAANITLTVDEVKELESIADGLGLNVIRFWEKEMK